MKKRSILILSLILVAVLLPLTLHAASAEEASGQCGDDLYWSFEESTGTLTVTGSGAMYDTYLNSDSAPWYPYHDRITTLVLEDGLTEICSNAFYYCRFTSVTIPDSVTTVKDNAFYFCNKMQSLTIGSGVTSIGNSAFYGSELLEALVIPDNVTSIGSDAFAQGKSLKTVTIGDGVTSIGIRAFYWCDPLTTVTIGSSVTSIGDEAFYGCGLTDVYYNGTEADRTEKLTVGSNNDPLLNATWHYASDSASGQCGDNLYWSFDENTSTLTITGSGAMWDYEWNGSPWYDYRESIISVVLPERVTSIGAFAFEFCEYLSSVTIPEGVIGIGDSAFWACHRLDSILFPDSLIHIGTYAFNATGLTDVAIPNGVTTIGDGAFRECELLAAVSVPESVTKIGYAAFGSCRYLSEISISSANSNFVSIDGVLFTADRTRLVVYPAGKEGRSYSIPDGTIDITEAFRGCSKLRVVTIPNSINTIGTCAFIFCNLSWVNIPKSVTKIGWGAFYYNGLSAVYYNGSEEDRQVIQIDAENEVLLNAEWHYNSSGPTEIGEDQCGIDLYWSIDETSGTLTITGSGEMFDFGGNDSPWQDHLASITSVVLPDGLKSVGNHAFEFCMNLTEITIPEGVTHIGDNAFFGCTSMKSALLPDGLTEIGMAAFNSSGLASITFPDSLQSIGAIAFRGCNQLTSIDIPKGVTDIGNGAFSGCDILTSITVSGENESYWSVNGVLFAEHYLLAYPTGNRRAVYTIPDGTINIASYAFNGCRYLETLICPESLVEIGSIAFRACRRLKAVYLQSSVARIERGAFYLSNELSDVYYSGNEEQKDAIEIDTLNESLLNATWHYLTEAVNGTVEWNSADVQFKGTTAYVIANGKAQTPRFTVKDQNGNVINPANYDYEYKENTNAGTGYVIVTFKGDYIGTCKGAFKIYLPATTATTVENVKDGIKLTWKKVTGAAGYVIYRRAWNKTATGWTDFVRWNNTTDLSWIDKTVYPGTRYQYGIKAYFERRVDPVSGVEIGGNVGDNFNLGEVGPLKTTVRITNIALGSLTAGKKQMTVKWTANTAFTGYEIRLATDKNFTKNVKTVKVTSAKTASNVVKSLKSGTTYYVQIRAYHVFNGTTYFGAWSASKTCKVK